MFVEDEALIPFGSMFHEFEADTENEWPPKLLKLNLAL